MILVDTSVWIDHLRRADLTLSALLDAGQVVAHPFVVGEVALGQLRHSDLVIGMLQRLPQAKAATNQEVLHFIRRHSLAGEGIGYVDAHLLVAARLTAGGMLWTRDKRLSAVAKRLRLAAGF